MSEENRCPECGAPRPAHAPKGLCPGCLLKRGLETAPPALKEAGQASGAFTPPTPEQLAAQFPELEILEFIGRGGMGMVYKARQKHLDRFVALKILLPSIAQDAAFAERFGREARAMAMLSHPHIVTVHDFGQTRGEGREERGEGSLRSPLPTNLRSVPGQGQGEGEFPRPSSLAPCPLYYFVMEFVDGLTLRQLLDGGKLAPQEALAIVPQICEALQFAHDKGVVHRDIKPENILMDRSGQVKIADFGLAKLMGKESVGCVQRTDENVLAADDGAFHAPYEPLSPQLTGAGQVMGTPHYMAPEQTERPQEVDHRADIYSLGVVFYQMLTGELPIGRFAPPSRKVQIDVRLDEVVLRALEKEPDRRYQQASELKTRVETIVTTPAALAAAGSASGASGTPAIDDVRRQVQGPAIALLVLGILELLTTVPLLAAMAYSSASSRPGAITVAVPEPLAMFLAVLAVAVGCFTIVAAVKMKRLAARGLAIAASIVTLIVSPVSMIGILSLIGVPGGLIGMAIGIWSLVVLSRSEVANGFEQQRKAKPAPAGDTPTQSSREPAFPRLSRLAIAGAVWASFFLGVVLLLLRGHAIVPGSGSAQGGALAFIILAPLMALGLSAPFGTTILGLVSLSQIRHSAGRLYGLGLALFDALLYPLLILDGLIGWLWYALFSFIAEVATKAAETGHAYAGQHPEAASSSTQLVLALTLLTSAIVDFFIVRAAWREACKTAPRQSASPAPVSAGTNGNLGIYSLFASLLGVIVVLFMVAVLMSRNSTVGDILLPAIVLLFAFELPAAILGIAGWKTRLGKAATALSSVLMILGSVAVGALWTVTQTTQQQRLVQATRQLGVEHLEAQLSRAVVAELHQQDIAATVLDCHIDRGGTRAEARITGARYKKDARGLRRRTPIDGRLLMEAGPARPNCWQVRGEDALRDLQFAVVLGLDAARPAMEQFLAAVRASDLEKMKALSLGSVNGWLDREQAQRLRATRLSGIYLPAMTEMLESLQRKTFVGRVDRIQLWDTACRDQWAGATVSTGVGDDHLVLIFRDTAEDWRFVHWEIMNWLEQSRPPLQVIIDEFAQNTQQRLDDAKTVASKAAASKPADATQTLNEGAGGEAAVREVALRFLTAVRDEDLETMKSLSLGAYEGWMSDQQAAAAAQQHERILPGLHATTLEKTLRAVRAEVFDKDLAALKNIQETAVLADFAAVGVPFPASLKNPKQAIFIFKKTPQGWRFLSAEIGRDPLDAELRRDVPKFEQLLRGVKGEPAAAATSKSAEPGQNPNEAADAQKIAHMIHELKEYNMALPTTARMVVERYQAGQLHGVELKAAIAILEPIVAAAREARERDGKAADGAKDAPARPGSPGARLEFRIMPNASGSSRMPIVPLVGGTAESFVKGALQELAEKGPEAARLVAPEFAWIELAASTDPPGALIGKHKDQRYILLCAGEPYAMLPKSEGAGAWRIEKAEAVKDEKGQFTIAIQFDTLGGQRLGELTKANLGNTMAIVADGRVLAAPRIQSTITRQVQITGRFTEQEARDLAKAIQSGAASGAPPVSPPGKESTEKGREAARTDPLKSARAADMRTIVLAGLEYAMDHPEWPGKLDELKPRYVDADKIDLGRFVYHPPGRQSPAKNPQEVAVLSEKEPAFAGGQLVGFADGYVAFIHDPELLRRLLPVEAESPQPFDGKKEAK